jgi:uroporphyrinogen-III decarboxylase
MLIRLLRRQIVGKGGAGVTKLREDLGVRINFGDKQRPAAAEAVSGKKKTKPKTPVTIKGRRENVEEAKKRVLSQADKLVSRIF